jgi:tyrosinase
MFDVAEKYDEPLKATFRAAAFEFRLPFFDYWRPRRGPGNFTFPGVISNNQTAYDYDFSAPAIFTAEKVTVRKYPKGTPTSLDPNPLHHYAFTEKAGSLTTTEWDSISQDVGQHTLSPSPLLT